MYKSCMLKITKPMKEIFKTKQKHERYTEHMDWNT